MLPASRDITRFHYFRRRYGGQVIGIRRKDNWPLRGEGIVACDGDDRDALARLFDKHQFAAVLNCEGTCKLKSCEMDPKMAERVNIDSVTTMLDVIGGASTRLVHLSIDLVFSGTRGGGHVEHDETDPVTVYGKTMAEAERILLERSSRAHSVCRHRATARPLFRLRSTAHGVCLLLSSASRCRWASASTAMPGRSTGFGHRFKKGKPATLYFDEIRTPTYTDCLNPLLADVLARPDMTGLFHAGGPRRLSLFQIAQIVNRIGGYDPHLLHGCPRIDAGPMPPRAGDVTLGLEQARAGPGLRPIRSVAAGRRARADAPRVALRRPPRLARACWPRCCTGTRVVGQASRLPIRLLPRTWTTETVVLRGMSFYAELESQIAAAMQTDRQRLRNLLRAVRQAEEQGRPPDEQLDKLLAQIDESTRRREARQALVPELIYDESLPVVARREEIAAAIRDHQVVVVCGETGSGKSTQIPKICLEIGRGVGGMIGHTQPRRIAARSIASRLGEELGTSVGQKVGFKIRFTDATGPQTLVKVMTDGVLLAESQHDRLLRSIRHADHRRSPRAVAQHRLPARLSEAAPAQAARSAGGDYQRDDRCPAVCGAFLHVA